MRKLICLLASVFLFGCSTPAVSNTAGSIFAELDRQLERKVEARDTANHYWTKNGMLFRCRLSNNSDKMVYLQVWQNAQIVHAEKFEPHTESYVWLYNGHYAFQWREGGTNGKLEAWYIKGWRLTGKAAFIANITLDAWETTNEDFKNVH